MQTRKLFKVTSVSKEPMVMSDYVVATNYNDAVNKLVGDENFDYKYGDGFTIVDEGEVII